MAPPESPHPPEPGSKPPSEGEASWFEPGERVRWLTHTGAVIHHRGVPYVLFDHHHAPPGAAYAVTKLRRIAPVVAVVAADERTPPPPLPPDA